jgi:hypothetical protein
MAKDIQANEISNPQLLKHILCVGETSDADEDTDTINCKICGNVSVHKGKNSAKKTCLLGKDSTHESAAVPGD